MTENLAPDPLDAAYRCNACNATGQGIKRTEIVHWPPVLVLSFKRFEFDRRTLNSNKITRHIAYPMQYKPRPDVTYTLRAVIVHLGLFGAGHYVAYVRARNDQWYFCDDDMVPRRVVNPLDVLRQQAYMLIYER